MRRIAFLVLMMAVGLLTGCICVTTPAKTGQAPASVGRYQIAGDGQGHFMKIDTQTGKAWSTGGPKWADWFEVPER